MNLLVAAQDPQHSELSFSWEANVGSVSVVETTPNTSEVLFESRDCMPHALTATVTATATNAYDLSTTVRLPLGVRECGNSIFTATPAVSRVDHTATLLDSGQVLVVGGFSALAELYEPGTATWSAVGSLATARSSATATRLPSGKVLVTGGAHGSLGSLASAEVYDPETREWSATGSLATARTRHTATLLPSGKVLVVGGSDDASAGTAEVYDPEPGTWTPTGNLAMGRQGHTATLLSSGKVLVAGGLGGAEYLQTAELYDPETGTWSSTGSLATARTQHVAVLLPSGKVLVAGGHRAFGLSSAEVYDPEAGTWADTGQLSRGRYDVPATLLPSGKVLVASGSVFEPDDGQPWTTYQSEVYDPVSGAWNSTGNSDRGRARHTATLLPSGKVLLVGGTTWEVDGSDTPAPAELFSP
ncbi:Kelch repeat-containing protein [Pyxidicoccus trucidator]|uniref:Kelch repeat-containing protein n=1 Tax=Pyxidicoccus trucidator TaxID=2709662 RepID=UPI0013DAA4AB|nr:kelch repeat-containing protein [Pyxidicoccus trucidator]